MQNKASFALSKIMKKFFTALLALLYISTSTGASIHVHYCMGKLAGWGMGHNEASTCGKCGMQQSEKKVNDCCKDENKFIKNNTDQKTAEVTFQMAQVMAVALPVAFFDIPAADISSVTETNHLSHAPPRDSGVAIYIRNCVFRI